MHVSDPVCGPSVGRVPSRLSMQHSRYVVCTWCSPAVIMSNQDVFVNYLTPSMLSLYPRFVLKKVLATEKRILHHTRLEEIDSFPYGRRREGGGESWEDTTYVRYLVCALRTWVQTTQVVLAAQRSARLDTITSFCISICTSISCCLGFWRREGSG